MRICAYQKQESINTMLPLVSSPISILACKPLLVALLTPPPPPDKLDGNDTYDNIDAVERG